ncbi:MAG: hypothetical protein ACOYYS_23075 [Chloroflexota bacterium]
MFDLTPQQREWSRRPPDRALFLEGPAGSGKTTVGVERVHFLIETGIPAASILLLVPQRTLAIPYYDMLNAPGFPAGALVSVLTVGGLAQRMVELFWPLAAGPAGFALPDRPPTFLTLETAQYYMAHIVRPLLEQGYFEAISVDRNRLYSQVLDNLNKAAVVGFPHTEIGSRLKAAWVGEASQARIYDDAQDCAERFRRYCLANNLLDFSLQLEVFLQHLWPDPLVRDHLTHTYRHLVVDNVEEDTPVTHDLLRAWLPTFESALLIFDHEAGYRRFLGADPASAYTLRELCDEHAVFEGSFVTTEELEALGSQIGLALNRPLESPAAASDGALVFEYSHFYPEMLDWVAEQIAHLVFNEGVPPGEIAVLAPFLPDSLRFSLHDRLERLEILTRSHRPSRALREEAAVHCLLTLAMLAHPHWKLCPAPYDVAYAFVQAIAGLDLVRAQLLTEIVYRLRDGQPALSSFEIIKPETQARITYALGQRYEGLRAWLYEYMEQPEAELDYFLSRLFGELLSQPGYGFHPGDVLEPNYIAGEAAANLIQSARKFRWTVAPAAQDAPQADPASTIPVGLEYIQMVQDGVLAAQYLPGYQAQPEDAVLLAPAHTFLMRNQPVEIQFWLDVGSRGWFERLYQPLTHPYVLSRWWPRTAVWTDESEQEANQETLYRLARGLLRRCRRGVYLGLSELSEQGNEQKGPLLKAIQRVLRHSMPAQDTPQDFDE